MTIAQRLARRPHLEPLAPRIVLSGGATAVAAVAPISGDAGSTVAPGLQAFAAAYRSIRGGPRYDPV